jgi:hypothetical protein
MNRDDQTDRVQLPAEDFVEESEPFLPGGQILLNRLRVAKRVLVFQCRRCQIVFLRNHRKQSFRRDIARLPGVHFQSQLAGAVCLNPIKTWFCWDFMAHRVKMRGSDFLLGTRVFVSVRGRP